MISGREQPDGLSTATADSLDTLLSLYERWGAEHYDEDLSQLDHALQTAELACAEGADDALVAAALLHDVGHLLALRARPTAGSPPRPSTSTDQRHELVGARHLAGLFPPSVTGPVALHVLAKRYRCAVDPSYFEQLSLGSVRSLERQGGPLTTAEVRAFESQPASAAAVRLRAWDDAGKQQDRAVPALRSYRPLLEGLIPAAS